MEILLVARDPLRHRRAYLKIAKEIFVRIQTQKDVQKIRNAGSALVELWGHVESKPWAKYPIPEIVHKTYPAAIIYDWECWFDHGKHEEPTNDLKFECKHVPISVSVADTFNQTPTHILDPNPEELTRLFIVEIESRAQAVRQKV